MILCFAGTVQAQISVNLNLGLPPLWGPAGYSDARYYYLPDVEAYYDVQASMFVYPVGGRWVHRANLPLRYRNYDLYSGYKVVMTDYRGNTPYTHFTEHKAKYARGFHGEAQRNIGERPGKGNYKEKSPAKSNFNKKQSQRNSQNVGNSNNKNQKKGNRSGGGKK